MEINTEINKIFGEEMAKLFANQVSEEELEKKSREAWDEITKRPFSYGRQEKSQLEKMVHDQIVAKILSKVEEILKEPVSEELVQQQARDIANRAKEKATEMMIDTIAQNISNRMFNNMSDSYAINDGCARIAAAITQR